MFAGEHFNCFWLYMEDIALRKKLCSPSRLPLFQRMFKKLHTGFGRESPFQISNQDFRVSLVTYSLRKPTELAKSSSTEISLYNLWQNSMKKKPHDNLLFCLKKTKHFQLTYTKKVTHIHLRSYRRTNFSDTYIQ